MCLQCCTESDNYHAFENFIVIQATKDYGDIKKGYWGLVSCNDPEFWWSFDPTPAPLDTDESEEADKWYENLHEFHSTFLLSPKLGKKLTDNMEVLHLEPTAYAFIDYIGKFVKNNKPEKYHKENHKTT